MERKSIEERIANLSPEKRQLLSDRLRKQTPVKSQSIPLRQDRTSCIASFAQKRFWFVQQLTPNSSIYNNPKILKFEQPININALHSALQAIVDRHEVLRTTFDLRNGELHQIIAEKISIDLPIIDLRDRPESLQDLIKQEIERSFNLSSDIPVRNVLFWLNEKEYILLLVVHHIASDRWSSEIIINELHHVYQAFLTENLPSLPNLPIQYADFAQWQQQQLQQQKLKDQLDYWKEKLKGQIPILNLPTDYPRPGIFSNKGKRQPILINKSLTASLKVLSQQKGVTLFITLLTAFNVFLYRYSQQTDITVGTLISGRHRLETESLIGCFINTLPLRTDLSNNPSFSELLQQVRITVLDAYANQDLPFEKLIEELQPPRNLSYSPLFQTIFNFHNIPDLITESSAPLFRSLNPDIDTVEFDLTLSLREKNEELEGVLIYNTDLFKNVTIERMIEHFPILLASIVENPDELIAKLILGEVNNPKEKLSDLSIQKYSQNLSNFQQFNCYLIGHESLLIPCAESLLERGYQILGIISSGSLIKNWTESRSIPHIQPTDNLLSFLSKEPFDYLFSIYNLSILPEEILELPRQYAINCHDSLLPKYGGINATSWAILHQEKTHGVTWHKMTNLVDQGEIFKQIPINIAKDETAFTLNGKCYEVIIDSFTQLVEDLASNQVVLTKQSPDHRSYFLRSQKPSPGCLLSWKYSAYEIDALIRALDFGFYQNWLGLPKLAIGSEFIIISKIIVLDNLSNSPPGIITAIAANYLQVSTIDYDILLDQILTIDGQYLSIDELVRRFKLQLGDQFKDIDPNIAKQIKTFETLLVKHETFWINKLAILKPVVIPYAQQTGSLRSPTSEIKTKDWFVPNEVTKFLESHLKSGCLENFIVAAFAAYLARISQSCCFDLGLRWNELQNQLAGLEDFFACEVPCRIDIGYEQSFTEVFKAVNWQIELVKQHKTYSRDIVLRYPELQTVRELNYHGRFPVLVELVEKLDTCKTRAANPLTFVVPKAGNKCCFVYDDEAFNNDSITRIVEQFTIFVRSIVTDPNGYLANLQLLSDDELYKVLVEWNNTQVAYPQHKCIHHLFEDQVERTPDAVAIVFKKQQLTYRELNNRANQLAHYLQALGVKPERLVGICVERSIEMLVGLLGILKAGGVYIPLDPTYPKERLNYMVSDGQISLLLTQEKFQHQFTTKGVDQIFLDRDESAIAQKSQANLVSQVTPNNLAYIIYTSGSTGKPKGVTIEHRSLVNFTQAAIFEYGLNDTDSPAETLPERILQFASISFDTAAEEIYPCLISGATLVLRTEEMLTSVATFLKTCQDWQLTVLDLPTAYWQQIVSELETTDVKLPESLRLVIIGGERVLPESVKIWQKSVGKFPQLVNTYGPTEGTVVATTYKVTTSIIGNSVPIGRPITNTQIYILDHYLQPVPIGVPGELFIGGDGLARCYLNRLELTAEKFIFNPFKQGKLYKTGDIARYLLDGNIEFIGRIDNQVKIRGFRIELGEIEAVMGEHPYILNVVVIAREDIPGDKRLIAYIVSQPQATLNQSELRQFLKQKLCEYMIPSAFVFLEKFPLTPNGKIDRRALPTPEQIRLEPEEIFIAPRNELEQQLTKVWEAILGIKPIGVRDNFFALGGHSLLAVKLFTQIEKTFSINLPLAAIFQSPTIEELANILDSQGWSSPWYSLVPLQPKGSRPILFGIHHIYFQDLIRHLGEKQPVYALHYAIAKPVNQPLTLPKIEDLAAHYIQEMRSLQPQGPYFLMGLSFGGILAYEMAQQLIAQGQQVSLLALFDSRIKKGNRKLLPFSHRLTLLWNLEFPEFWERAKFRIKTKFSQLIARDVPTTNRTSPLDYQYLPHIYNSNPIKLLLNDYTPKSYLGRVVLFKAINVNVDTSITYSVEPPEVVWRKFVNGELVVHEVPGNHTSILKDPSVQIIAETLTQYIDEALVNHELYNRQ